MVVSLCRLPLSRSLVPSSPLQVSLLSLCLKRAPYESPFCSLSSAYIFRRLSFFPCTPLSLCRSTSDLCNAPCHALLNATLPQLTTYPSFRLSTRLVAAQYNTRTEAGRKSIIQLGRPRTHKKEQEETKTAQLPVPLPFPPPLLRPDKKGGGSFSRNQTQSPTHSRPSRPSRPVLLLQPVLLPLPRPLLRTRKPSSSPRARQSSRSPHPRSSTFCSVRPYPPGSTCSGTASCAVRERRDCTA